MFDYSFNVWLLYEDASFMPFELYLLESQCLTIISAKNKWKESRGTKLGQLVNL